jgi:hypothetical protein
MIDTVPFWEYPPDQLQPGGQQLCPLLYAYQRVLCGGLMNAEKIIYQVFLHGRDQDWRRELPQLTGSDEANLELYGLLAVITRQFIQSWYSKISSDTSFALEVVNAIGKIIRVLEKRVLELDLDKVLLDDLPFILDCHVQGKLTVVLRHNVKMLM